MCPLLRKACRANEFHVDPRIDFRERMHDRLGPPAHGSQTLQPGIGVPIGQGERSGDLPARRFEKPVRRQEGKDGEAAQKLDELAKEMEALDKEGEASQLGKQLEEKFKLREAWIKGEMAAI